MSRLIRGLWLVQATTADGSTFVSQPAEYDVAAVLAPMLGEEGVRRAILRPVPGTRARWESLACFEASDLPGVGRAVKRNATGYLYRSLTFEQAEAVRSARRAGVPARSLAAEYRVALRTIYRVMERAECDVRSVTLDGWRATFEMSDEGPVRVTPWFADVTH